MRFTKSSSIVAACIVLAAGTVSTSPSFARTRPPARPSNVVVPAPPPPPAATIVASTVTPVYIAPSVACGAGGSTSISRC